MTQRPFDEWQASQRFPRRARIRSTKDILALLKHGCRIEAGALDLYFRENSMGGPRVGIIVPKHGHPNVERNRLRRRIREIVRRGWLARRWREGASTDLLVRARPSAYELSTADLDAQLDKALGDV